VGETDANFDIVGPAIACSPYQVQFQHNQVNGVNYTWKWFDGVADSTYTATASQVGQIIRHTFFNPSPNGTVKYKVFLETSLDANYPGGCLKTTFREVQVYPTISTGVFADKTVICSDENVNFVNSSQGVSGTGHRWFYRVQGSNTELDVKTTSNVTYRLANTTANNPIVYEIVYQSTNGNCPAADVVTPITVYRGVDPKFSYTTPTLYIGGISNVTFTNTSVPVAATDFRYEWTFGLDGTPATANGVGPFNLTYSTPGPKEVKLVVTNIAAQTAGLICVKEYGETIQINVPPLVVDFVADPLRSCFPTDITVIENLATGDVFNWRVFDQLGKIAATSNANLPVFKIPAPGKYTIELTTQNSFTGDQKTVLKEFIIYDKPLALFDVRPALVYVPDTELSTFNFSTGANDFEWDFGDGTVLFEREPKHIYKIEGVYDITLFAKFDHGDNIVCSDTLQKKVTAKQGGVTRVPNAFTPNPNGPTGGAIGGGANANSFNDVFLPLVKGAEEFNMQIFDRWGNLIFESNNSNVGWDGYDRNGRIMPAGVYVYKLTLRLSDGQRTTQVGDITMIR
jgi:gliding motility-associated-like protein